MVTREISIVNYLKRWVKKKRN